MNKKSVDLRRLMGVSFFGVFLDLFYSRCFVCLACGNSTNGYFLKFPSIFEQIFLQVIGAMS